MYQDESKEKDQAAKSADSESSTDKKQDVSTSNSEANTTTTTDNSQSLGTTKKDEFDFNSLWMSLDMNTVPLDLTGLEVSTVFGLSVLNTSCQSVMSAGYRGYFY